jgi:hypothetical protein
MRATAKQTLGAATRAVARRRRDGEVLSWAGARQLQLSMQTKNHLNLKDPSGFLLMSCVDKKDTFAKHCATRLCGISMKIFQKSKSDFRTPDQ